ncbi:unnamed protein product [Amoebophrya sp. A120]|nr:unnamed protein product [Amoebophrya sp. A120]|eukprot:GSA120T00008151001.1
MAVQSSPLSALRASKKFACPKTVQIIVCLLVWWGLGVYVISQSKLLLGKEGGAPVLASNAGSGSVSASETKNAGSSGIDFAPPAGEHDDKQDGTTPSTPAGSSASSNANKKSESTSQQNGTSTGEFPYPLFLSAWSNIVMSFLCCAWHWNIKQKRSSTGAAISSLGETSGAAKSCLDFLFPDGEDDVDHDGMHNGRLHEKGNSSSSGRKTTDYHDDISTAATGEAEASTSASTIGSVSAHGTSEQDREMFDVAGASSGINMASPPRPGGLSTSTLVKDDGGGTGGSPNLRKPGGSPSFATGESSTVASSPPQRRSPNYTTSSATATQLSHQADIVHARRNTVLIVGFIGGLEIGAANSSLYYLPLVVRTTMHSLQPLCMYVVCRLMGLEFHSSRTVLIAILCCSIGGIFLCQDPGSGGVVLTPANAAELSTGDATSALAVSSTPSVVVPSPPPNHGVLDVVVDLPTTAAISSTTNASASAGIAPKTAWTNVSHLGLFFGVMAPLCGCTRWALMQRLVHEFSGPCELLLHTAPITGVVLAVGSFLFEPNAFLTFVTPMFAHFLTYEGIHLLIRLTSIGLAVMSLLLAELRVLQLTSALTLCIFGVCHNLLLIVAGMVVFREKLNYWQLVGVASGQVGVLLYGIAKTSSSSGQHAGSSSSSSNKSHGRKSGRAIIAEYDLEDGGDGQEHYYDEEKQSFVRNRTALEMQASPSTSTASKTQYPSNGPLSLSSARYNNFGNHDELSADSPQLMRITAHELTYDDEGGGSFGNPRKGIGSPGMIHIPFAASLSSLQNMASRLFSVGGSWSVASSPTSSATNRGQYAPVRQVDPREDSFGL